MPDPFFNEVCNWAVDTSQTFSILFKTCYFLFLLDSEAEKISLICLNIQTSCGGYTAASWPNRVWKNLAP